MTMYWLWLLDMEGWWARGCMGCMMYDVLGWLAYTDVSRVGTLPR